MRLSCLSGLPVISYLYHLRDNCINNLLQKSVLLFALLDVEADRLQVVANDAEYVVAFEPVVVVDGRDRVLVRSKAVTTSSTNSGGARVRG